MRPSRARAPSTAFLYDLLADGGVLFEEGAELIVDDRFDVPLHVAVAELRLRLSLELRVLELNAYYGP